MSAEDYSKLTSDQWAKMTPPLGGGGGGGDGYAKLTDHNWNQSYGGNVGGGGNMGSGIHGAQTAYHHPHAHPHAHHHHHHHLAAVANNEYAHQMQASGYGNPNSKYWS